MFHVYHLCGFERERRRLRRGHDRLAGHGDPFTQGAATARIELRQHVVEQQERSDGEQLASARIRDSTASRCSP